MKFVSSARLRHETQKGTKWKQKAQKLCAFCLCLLWPFTLTADDFAVLIFSKTAGFRHDSIPAGISAIDSFAAECGFTAIATEDPALFNDQNLSRYRVVVFLNTTGDVLDDRQQVAFERFIQQGGGFVGVHSATDTEYDWPFYGALVGSYFAGHPAIQSALLKVVDHSHPSTRNLPLEWTRTDEWYDFAIDPGPTVNVLVTVDEATYSGGNMGVHHPISWYREYAGGRAWYTAMGHTIESFREPLFLDHLRGGILWAAGGERLCSPAGRAPAERDVPRRVIRRPGR